MRIKSYFAPSVQAAIALARKEFGDCVTLVTSHVASLDNRHLGEYEVVFAIEEVIKEEAVEDKVVLASAVASPEPIIEAPAAPVFTQMFQQAIQTPLPMHENLDGKLEHIHASLVALGLESPLVRSFMTMLKAVLPAAPAQQAQIEISAPVVVEPEPVVTLEPQIVIEERPAAKPRITIIKSETPQPFKPEPVKSEPVAMPVPAPALVPVAGSPRRFLSLFESARPEPLFSAAELAFMSSVSSSPEQKA